MKRIRARASLAGGKGWHVERGATRLLVAGVALLAACIPAATPEHLANTPGAPVVVTDRRYEAGPFSAAHPDGWRVITSPAEAAPFVIYASPDNCAIIVLSSTTMDAPMPACEGERYRTDARTIQTDAGAVYASAAAPESRWEAFAALFEAVVESVRVKPAT